jgi:SAM-dependent methyltransferase
VAEFSFDRIREDFDRIARLGAGETEHPSAHEDFIISLLPTRCRSALEVGCGTGRISRAIASRMDRVVAIDLSPEMIRVCREQSRGIANITFRCAEFLTEEIPEAPFDYVFSSATLHHLPLEPAIERMKELVRPGGTVVVHDLRADDGLLDHFRSAIAFPLAALGRCWSTGRFRSRRELRDAWRDHGERETYLTMSEVRRVSERHFPSAEVYRHLLWRYTIVWRKPEGGECQD